MKKDNVLSEPRVAALAITYRGDELLLIKRKKQPQRYGWGYPGGSVLPNESIFDAAVRELKEETGVDAAPETILPIVEIREFDDEGEHHHFILVPVVCRYEAGTAVADDDALDCRWMSLWDISVQAKELIEHVATVAKDAKDVLKHNVSVPMMTDGFMG